MILNHKDAVEFLVGNAAEIGFNRYTILNLHAILANNLLADERAAGRLRYIGVGIDGSVYHPPETPQLVEECFDQLLATAAAHIASWATAHLEEGDRAAFREVAETEVLGLHEGNFARYPIRPGEFAAWQAIWEPRDA